MDFEVQSNTLVEETPEPKADEQVEEEQPTKEQPKEEQPKKKSRAQKRIESLSAKSKAQLEKIAELEAKLAEKEIDPADYDDVEEYEKAKKAKKPKKDDDFASIAEEIDIKFDDAREKYEDFDEKVKSEELPITKELVIAMNESDNAGEVAYYLANNIGVVKKLIKLPLEKMVYEIAKLESKVGKKESKKTTKAPEPIEPVGGGGATASKQLNELNYSEFEAERNKKSNKKFW